MDDKDKDKYLPEDQDILKEIQSINFDTSGIALEQRKAQASKLQILATLRSRKQMADYDKSNKKFTIILGAFALVQVLIAGCQFTLEAATSENKILAIVIALVFAAFIIWFVKEIEKILGA